MKSVEVGDNGFIVHAAIIAEAFGIADAACRVALKSETRRVRGYFLPLIMRFHCHRAYAFRALPGDVIDRGKQTWLLIEGAQ